MYFFQFSVKKKVFYLIFRFIIIFSVWHQNRLKSAELTGFQPFPTNIEIRIIRLMPVLLTPRGSFKHDAPNNQFKFINIQIVAA